MPLPSPDELLRRLRAVYCRHKGLTYEQYDALVAAHRLSMQEVWELLEVLFGEINNLGLVDFLFAEDARAREELKELNKAIDRVAQMSQMNPERADELRPLFNDLRAKQRALNADLPA